jgi:hypothetical protein
MRKIFMVCIACVALVIAAVSQAAYWTPSSLFAAIDDGKPKVFSGEIHGRVDDLFISVWYNGATESKILERMKTRLNFTVDVSEEGSTLRTRIKLLLYQSNAYFLVESVEGGLPGASLPDRLQPFIGRWVKAPIDKDIYAFLLREGSDFSLLDELFNVKIDRIPEGRVYSVHMEPHVLNQILSIVKENYTVSDFLFLQGDVPINFHMKVDANEEDQFRFLRYHLSFDFADESIELRMQGEMERIMTPVYLGIPRRPFEVSESFSSFIGGLLPFEEYERSEDEWEEFIDDYEAAILQDGGVISLDAPFVGRTVDDIATEIEWGSKLATGEQHLPGLRPQSKARAIMNMRREQSRGAINYQKIDYFLSPDGAGYHRPTRRFVHKNYWEQRRVRSQTIGKR